MRFQRNADVLHMRIKLRWFKPSQSSAKSKSWIKLKFWKKRTGMSLQMEFLDGFVGQCSFIQIPIQFKSFNVVELRVVWKLREEVVCVCRIPHFVHPLHRRVWKSERRANFFFVNSRFREFFSVFESLTSLLHNFQKQRTKISATHTTTAPYTMRLGKYNATFGSLLNLWENHGKFKNPTEVNESKTEKNFQPKSMKVQWEDLLILQMRWFFQN